MSCPFRAGDDGHAAVLGRCRQAGMNWRLQRLFLRHSSLNSIISNSFSSSTLVRPRQGRPRRATDLADRMDSPASEECKTLLQRADAAISVSDDTVTFACALTPDATQPASTQPPARSLQGPQAWVPHPGGASHCTREEGHDGESGSTKPPGSLNISAKFRVQ